MAVYDFFVSRNNNPGLTVTNYVGHKGRLFYDDTNGLIRISDGITPGGNIVQNPALAASSVTPPPGPFEGMLWYNPTSKELWAYHNGSFRGTINPATTTALGGIKAGPGANVSVDGTLTIDTTGLPLSFGDFVANVNILTMASVDQNMVLATKGNAEVQLVGNIGFYSPNGLPPSVSHRYFEATDDGQIKITVPASDPGSGAVEIVGSLSGNVYPPVNTGVMLHVTGNNNDASRIYNDGVGSFAAFVGRRLNGGVSSPTAVVAGDEIIRISSTGYNGSTIPGSGSARIVYQAIENYTPTAFGSNISLWTCAIGSNVLTKIVTVDSADGLTATRATIQGNLTVNGNLVGNAITTTATIGTANVATINVSAGTTTRAPIRYAAGTNLTTAVSGAFEYDGVVPMFTPSDAQRGVVPAEQFFVQNTNRTLTYTTTAAQNLFAVNPSLSANTRYYFRLKAFVGRTTGDNNTSVVMGWGGTATLNRVSWTVQSRVGAANTVGALNAYNNTITANFTNRYTVTGISTPPDTWNLLITGIINVGAVGGTVIPTITWTGATAPGTVTVYAPSNFHLYPIGGSTGNVQIGNWL